MWRPRLFLPMLALYVAAQVLGGNLVTPLVQSRAVDLPPGLLGVALAAPLSAMALVAARRGHVEGWLEAGEGSGVGLTDRTPSAAPTRKPSP